MNIEKYKIELESAIYEGTDGKFFIGGKIVEKVLNDYHNEQLNLAVGYSVDLHAKHTRLDRIKCWLKYGHTLPKFGSDAMVWQCQRCGKILYATYR